jgi:hypothetical protein
LKKKCCDLHNSLQEEICLKGVLLAKNQNLSNQLDSLKDTNSCLIDYVKSINKKLEPCPSVLFNFKYWGTRPQDSTNQSAVSAFDLNSFVFLDSLFSVISENSFYKIAIFSDELENVKQLNFSLQKFENDNIEFEKSVLIYIIVYRWYEDLMDDGLISTLTVCPSVLSDFKYWGTRP